MNSTQALVPISAAATNNGNGDAVAVAAQSGSPVKTSSAPAPLTDELVARILKGRGLGGWLRAGRIGRVLGLLTLYLFLDTYDVRAAFNRRMAARVTDELPKGLAE